METRRLGNTDLKLTTIGLGTWAIGGSWEYGWGPQDDDDSIRAILTAVDKGINWIDTAPAYGCGHSEEIVGKTLKQMSARPIIATKCGLSWDSRKRKVNCLDRDAIVKEAESSLKRLGVDVIDLWQLHWPVPNEQLDEAWEAMAKVLKQGKVRYIGASNFTVDQLRQVAAIEPAVSLQPPYSMLNRDAEHRLFEYCKENSMGIVCYSPMQKGLLTGKYTPEKVAALPPDDHRHRDPNFQGKKLLDNMAIVDKIRAIAERNGKTAAQCAIAWVLRNDCVTAAIVGARNEKQITETIQAGGWQLCEEDIKEIDKILK